jgi:hypothetical protein
MRTVPANCNSGAQLVVVDSTPYLNRGCGVVCGEGTRHWGQGRWFWGEGAFHSLCGLTSEGAEVATVVMIVLGEVGVINRAMVPKVGVPLQQDAVGVMAVDMWGWASATPVSHSQAVEAEPLCCHNGTHHVAWPTPSDNNCRWAVDGT